MIFENINQYQKAKKILISEEGNTHLASKLLKNDPVFYNMSEGQILLGLNSLKEGLGDDIANFVGSAFGGDIAKIKTVLTQMKEQELKFNQEEFEIHKDFYKTLEDQDALEKDVNNPDYQALSKKLAHHRNSLNTRMRELNKMHEEIFDALELKIKDLTGDNKRKRKYFNAQRASDVLETRNDRYEKIKSIVAKSKVRSNELEKFFGVSVDGAKKEVEESKEKAEKMSKDLNSTAPVSSDSGRGSEEVFTEEPEKTLQEEFENIKNSPGGYISKKKALVDLKDEIEKQFAQIQDDEKKTRISRIYTDSENLIQELEREYKKVK